MLTRKEITGLCLAFLVSLPLVTTRLYASDEIQYFAWLRSVAFDNDVDFQNEYQYFYDAGVSRSAEFHETFLERANEAGRRINYTPPGTALLWAPFFAIGHAAAMAEGAPENGFSRPYIAAIAYGSACYGFLAVLLSASIARRVTGRGVGASLVVAIGTPLLFYAYLAPGFGHATSAFAVSLFVWTWIRVRARWTAAGAIALGVCAGLMATVREQDLLLALGPAVDFLMSWAGSRGRSVPRKEPMWAVALMGTVAFAAAYTPLLFAYTALNGHPGPTETAARKMTWTAPHALSVLIDPEHGLFAWTPLALVAIVGLLLLWWRGAGNDAPARDAIDSPDARRIAALALLMIAVQAYTSGSVESWTVAGAFGQRRFVAITPLLVLGLAALFAHARAGWPRRALITVVVLCVWWNLGLMAQFGLNRMDRQKLTLGANARATFLELPREAPEIVWRYVTDRASLYKLPRK